MSAIILSPNELKSLEDCLCNTSGNVPLHTRFRALFTLKALKSEDAVTIISKGMMITIISLATYLLKSICCSLFRSVGPTET